MAVLNVGGERHEVGWSLLEGQPRSRLGRLALATTADQVDFSVSESVLKTFTFSFEDPQAVRRLLPGGK